MPHSINHLSLLEQINSQLNDAWRTTPPQEAASMPRHQLQPGESYRLIDGHQRLWWHCTTCDRDLGPAAAQYQDDHFPIAFAGPKGETLCGRCYDTARGQTHIRATWTPRIEVTS